MGEAIDKTKGNANKIAGAAKEVKGAFTGDKKLEKEGEAQQTKGTAQKVKGAIKGAFGDDV